jgi:hypothetical protein
MKPPLTPLIGYTPRVGLTARAACTPFGWV